MKTVKLATGKEIDVTECLCDSRHGILYITLYATFQQALDIFENPENTKFIECGIDRYENFTLLSRLVNEMDGMIRVDLEAV